MPKSDTVSDEALAAGKRLAQSFFASRGGRRNPNQVEVHLDRATLAALLALAYEEGRVAIAAPAEVLKVEQ